MTDQTNPIPLLKFDDAEQIGPLLHDQWAKLMGQPPADREDPAWVDLVQFVLRTASAAVMDRDFDSGDRFCLLVEMLGGGAQAEWVRDINQLITDGAASSRRNAAEKADGSEDLVRLTGKAKSTLAGLKQQFTRIIQDALAEKEL